MSTSFIPAEPGWVALYKSGDDRWFYPIIGWVHPGDDWGVFGIVRGGEWIMRPADHDSGELLGYFHPVRAPLRGRGPTLDALISDGYEPEELNEVLGVPMEQLTQ